MPIFSIQIITIEDELALFEHITQTHCNWLFVPFEVQRTAFVVSENMDYGLLRTLNNAIDINMEEISAIQVAPLPHFMRGQGLWQV